MKICILGTGYVGLVTGTCFAEVGNEVVSVDKNIDKINKLQTGKCPIFEPHLETLIQKNLRDKRLHFTTDLTEGLLGVKICFLCVDTPPQANGQANLSNVVMAAQDIGGKMTGPLVVAIKSTVPIGTSKKIKEIIQEILLKRSLPIHWIQIASNPEFLKEGNAVEDFLKPSRVIVGSDSKEVIQLLHQLYLPFMRKQDRFLIMDVPSSELTKYACNAMLATRISFMNQLAQLAEKVGANISKIRDAMGLDSRIGPEFLYPGLGYGGSCFPKDVKALIQTGREVGESLYLLAAVDEVNEKQKEWFWKKIQDHYAGKLTGLQIAVWGGAFKPNTDDIRCSPILTLIDRLLEEGAQVTLFDPEAMKNLQEKYQNRITLAPTSYECLKNADGLIIATEWGEFRSPDFEKIKKLMRSPVIFDGRNLYDPSLMIHYGFKYFGIGIQI